MSKIKQLFTKSVTPIPLNAIPECDRVYIEKVRHLWSVEGAYICGGAAATWFTGKSIISANRDIDIFCQNADVYEKVINNFTDALYRPKSIISLDFIDLFRKPDLCVEKIYDTDNAVTYSISTAHNCAQWKMQVIKNKPFDDIQELFDRFDISVCMVATDGNNWFYNSEFIRDIKTNTLNVLNIGTNTAGRVLRYCLCYGFSDTPGLLSRLVTSQNQDLTGNGNYKHI